MLEVEVEESVATGGATITVEVLHSNSGKEFLAMTSGTVINGDSIAAPPYRKMVVYNAMVIGALVQVRVTLAGTAPWAQVRIWACGRRTPVVSTGATTP